MSQRFSPTAESCCLAEMCRGEEGTDEVAWFFSILLICAGRQNAGGCGRPLAGRPRLVPTNLNFAACRVQFYNNISNVLGMYRLSWPPVPVQYLTDSTVLVQSAVVNCDTTVELSCARPTCLLMRGDTASHGKSTVAANATKSSLIRDVGGWQKISCTLLGTAVAGTVYRSHSKSVWACALNS
jgi:hypothetical protein